jgi:putative FmdB family regulatory protein
MPIYEYACTVCGHRFEELQEMKDAPKESCPQCGKPVRRLMSTAVPISGKGGSGHVHHGGCCGGSGQCGGGMPSCPGGGCCN